MNDKYCLNKESKQFVMGGIKYPLLYGLCCPITGDPILVVLKTRGDKLKEVSDITRCGHSYSEGEITGLYFYEADFPFHTTLRRDGKELALSVRYFYGLKEDKLIENLHRDVYKGRKLKLETFRNKLLSGELKEFVIGREIVNGDDMIVAYIENQEELKE